MLNIIFQFLHRVYNFASGLDRTQWLLVMVGILACGALLLRGMGARSSY